MNSLWMLTIKRDDGQQGQQHQEGVRPDHAVRVGEQDEQQRRPQRTLGHQLAEGGRESGPRSASPENASTLANRATHTSTGLPSKPGRAVGPARPPAAVRRRCSSSLGSVVQSDVGRVRPRCGAAGLAAGSSTVLAPEESSVRSVRSSAANRRSSPAARMRSPMVRTFSTLERPAVTTRMTRSAQAVRWSAPTAGSRSARIRVTSPSCGGGVMSLSSHVPDRKRSPARGRALATPVAAARSAG